jgi:hypothetical protein
MRKAWVNLVTGAAEEALWDAMDAACLALAQGLATRGDGNPGGAVDIQYFYNLNGPPRNTGDFRWHNDPPPASQSHSPDDPANKVRDGLGTTHHEAGTLWMGNDQATSVTDENSGRFHHVTNAYVAGPALFPTIGSANPSLAGLTLARMTADAIAARMAPAVPNGFRSLGNGNLDGWRMSGPGRFIPMGGNLIESEGGTGILWYTREQFDDFLLRIDWRANDRSDNSGVYIRCPALDPTDPTPADQSGYEVQIDERGFNSETGQENDPMRFTGAVYNLAPANALTQSQVGAWHQFEIEANGSLIIVRLDSNEVSRLTNANRNMRGFIGLQAHHAGSRVQFRNILIQ